MKPHIESIKKTDRGIEAIIVADVKAIKKLTAHYALTHPTKFRFQ